MKAFINIDKICLAICFFLFQNLSGYAQDQRVADSLAKIYQEGNLEGIEKLDLLRHLSYNEMKDLDLSIRYAEELIALSNAEKNKEYLSRGYYLKGNANTSLGNYETAIKAYFNSAKVANEIEDIVKEGGAYTAVADVYSEDGQYENAEKYYKKAIPLLQKTDRSDLLGIALCNAGNNYFRHNKYDLALEYFEQSGLIFKTIDDLNFTAYMLGNIGMVYAEQGKDELALINFDKAIPTLEEFEDFEPICVYQRYISDVYLKQNNWAAALSSAQKSLDLAQQYGLKKQIRDANLKLTELYEQKGDYEQSYKYYKDYIVFKDSVTNPSSVAKIADLRFNYEDSKKQLQLLEKDSKIKQQRTIKYISIFAFTLVFLLALGLYRRYHFVKKTNSIIDEEKKRSQNLLLNILPKETAQELIQSGKVKAQKFDSVTVLFTDFIGFTNYAENLTPEQLVESVDYYFSKFDEIMEKHQLEKIKTVGDSYMCAGGLHYHKDDHALKIVQAANEISEFVKKTKKEIPDNITHFDMRIGINTGPVIAGVVGTRKFAYDIWGDTVNIASRMETSSEPGKINISENTYKLIKDAFSCEYRGEFEVKNKGKMRMYFVETIKDKTILN